MDDDFSVYIQHNYIETDYNYPDLEARSCNICSIGDMSESFAPKTKPCCNLVQEHIGLDLTADV
jgi:hypothetical protein